MALASHPTDGTRKGRRDHAVAARTSTAPAQPARRIETGSRRRAKARPREPPADRQRRQGRRHRQGGEPRHDGAGDRQGAGAGDGRQHGARQWCQEESRASGRRRS